MPKTSELIENIIKSRYSCSKFINKKINNETLNRILCLTLRSPTPFNIQNYKIMKVIDPIKVNNIRNSLNEGCRDKVINAIPIVFLSDLKPSKSMKNFEKLCKEEELPESFFKTTSDFVGYFLKESCVDGYKSPLSSMIRGKLLLPSAQSSYTYGEKTVGLVVSTFVTLCEGNDIQTHIMESFADWIVSKELNIPSRYHPSIIVWIGYKDDSENVKKTLRYKPEDMIFEDDFNNSIKL